jgi:two-component system response regulator TctD
MIRHAHHAAAHLMRRGLHVDVAADGPSALAHWQTREPDAVVLDLSLPGLDGLQVLERARAWACARRC